MKKILKVILLISVLVLMSGVASAATTAPVKYTTEQQACIKAAQTARMASVKTATDALNAATKDALKTRQDAIIAAQKTKDTTARMAAIKAANDEYNNDSTVKTARAPYMSAVKVPNENFQAAVKACISGSGNNGLGGSLFEKAGASILNALTRLFHFFTEKK